MKKLGQFLVGGAVLLGLHGQWSQGQAAEQRGLDIMREQRWQMEQQQQQQLQQQQQQQQQWQERRQSDELLGTLRELLNQQRGGQ